MSKPKAKKPEPGLEGERVWGQPYRLLERHCPFLASVSSTVKYAHLSLPCSAVRWVSHSINKQFPSPTWRALNKVGCREVQIAP